MNEKPQSNQTSQEQTKKQSADQQRRSGEPKAAEQHETGSTSNSQPGSGPG